MGISLIIIGKILEYTQFVISHIYILNILLLFLLILNGCFLSFYVSPILLNLEKQGIEKPLPNNLQNKIKVDFLFSFFGWWGMLLLFIKSLL